MFILYRYLYENAVQLFDLARLAKSRPLLV